MPGRLDTRRTPAPSCSSVGQSGPAAGGRAYRDGVRFEFAFENKYRPALAVLGVTPMTSRVDIDEEWFDARFGPWRCRTPVDNIWCVQQSGPYSAVKAIGARGSFADRGATFGSTTAGGVCVQFRDAVKILDPSGIIRHPGLTVTVSDRDGLVAAVRRFADITD